MKKYSREDQQIMAIWSLDCAERVLHFFEEVSPQDDRPLAAIRVGREWVHTGSFSMPVIRGASLAAHAAAKEVSENGAACHAAHAAGQAVATAHVPKHAYGGAYYALRAIAASGREDMAVSLRHEWEWQSQALPEHLRDEIMGRIQILKRGKGFHVTLQKGPGF